MGSKKKRSMIPRPGLRSRNPSIVGEWRFSCSPDRFARLRSDKGFQLLICLGRHLNALRYTFNAVTGLGDGDGPAETRQRSATFIYQGSILFEGLKLLLKLRPHFESLKEWKHGFGAYGDDDAIVAQISQGEDLQKLRNHVGFHMLEMVPEKSLPKLRMAEYVLVSGSGSQGANLYYDLADTVAAHHVCGSPADGAQFESELVRIATETRDAAMRFVTSGDLLMRGALDTYKIRMKSGRAPAPRRDTSQLGEPESTSMTSADDKNDGIDND